MPHVDCFLKCSISFIYDDMHTLKEDNMRCYFLWRI